MEKVPLFQATVIFTSLVSPNTKTQAAVIFTSLVSPNTVTPSCFSDRKFLKYAKTIEKSVLKDFDFHAETFEGKIFLLK